MTFPRLPHWLVLVLILLITGLSATLYKVTELGFPIAPDEQSEAWTVQARVQVRATGGPVKVNLRLPGRTPGFNRLNETFVSRDFGLTLENHRRGREAEWARRRARGTHNLYHRATWFRSPGEASLPVSPQYPPVPDLPEPFATAAATLVEDVREHSADIASYTAEMLRRLNSSDPSQEIRLFLTSPEYGSDWTTTAQLLLAGARIPSVQLLGIRLNSLEQRAPLVRWLAIHNEQNWLFFNPLTAEQILPDDFLLWSIGDGPLAWVTGAELTDTQITIQRNSLSSLELATQRAAEKDSRLVDFSPLGLPLHAQNLYQMLLMIPLGALMIVLLRNIVGMRSFGTFMPVLIALAFRETRLLAGIILFLVVVGVGLLLRFYLERLRLLLVPRLAAVLTIVVILLIGVGVVSYQLNIEVGLSVALFPMVIIAMVIERMSISWEERGPRDAMIEGAGSLVMAILAFLVMEQMFLRHLMLVFPELLLVVLGLTIAIGRYTGYRLSELGRFRHLAKPPADTAD